MYTIKVSSKNDDDKNSNKGTRFEALTICQTLHKGIVVDYIV